MYLIKRLAKLFTILTCIFLVNLSILVILIRFDFLQHTKILIVTTSMTTLNHQYIANIFASGNDIEKIMQNNKVVYTAEPSRKDSVTIMAELNFIDPVYMSEENMDPRRKLVRKISDTVEMIHFSGNGYKGHMFVVTNPKRIKLVSTKSLGEFGSKLNTLIKENDGIGGVNAGGFMDDGGVGNGGTPTGIIVEDGEIKYMDRKSTTFSIIGFDKKGILILGNYNLEQIKDLEIEQAISFYPFLVINGKPTDIYGDGGWGINPRTAIGQRADGAVLLLVIDGRQASSVGATIKEVQRLMVEYGAVNAANLDGGSSTVMYYEGKLINKPCSPYGERYLPTAFIIKRPQE